MEYHSAIKGGILTNAITWMNLGDIMLSDVSQM